MRISRLVILGVGVVVFVVLVVVFALLGKENASDTAAVVSTEYGQLEGEWLEGAQGGGFKYAAFRGIPYAQPPVGPLRFKSPKPPSKWNGVRQAKQDGAACFQLARSGLTGAAGSSEDCLYLNVYTPRLPNSSSKDLLPVYFYIHGGIFQYGNGGKDEYGPDFLVEDGIIVVTLNYRLGALGYMSLDTDDIPGNVGLKDAVFALKWVQRNIAQFGGDKNKVTIGGQSSGGVSAAWLTVLPTTKGLLRSAIIQSGTAVSSWGFNTKHIEFAKEVYRFLSNKRSDNLIEIANTLVTANATQLLLAASAATITVQETKDLGTDIVFFYLPTPELRNQGTEEKLIEGDAESYLIGAEHDIPIILGETQREWSQFFLMSDAYKNASVLQNQIKNLKSMVPNSIRPKDRTQQKLGIASFIAGLNIDDYVKKITDRFFTSPDPECGQNDACKMAKYLDQAYIEMDSAHFLQLRAKYLKSPSYAYVFDLNAEYNKDSANFPEYLKNVVIHGADMRYIWKSKDSIQTNKGSDVSSKALARQVRLFTNFVRVGNPTHMPEALIPVQWLPVENGGKEKYLYITENLKLIEGGMAGDHSAFWQSMTSELRNGLSP